MRVDDVAVALGSKAHPLARGVLRAFHALIMKLKDFPTIQANDVIVMFLIERLVEFYARIAFQSLVQNPGGAESGNASIHRSGADFRVF